MRWIKLKHLFAPEGQYPWMHSHAANPVVEVLPDGTWLVYFTSRDTANRSHISALIIDPQQNFRIQSICPRPLLQPGQAGLFDDSGTAMGYLIHINNRRYLYYLGWNLKVTVPWLNTIGLALESGMKEDGFPVFEKFSLAPLMDRSAEDPFSISYPSILWDEHIFRMWYGSNLSWGKDQHEMQHVIKYAESNDGIHWNRLNIISVPLEHPNEYALSKPIVLKENGVYKMWYSYRGCNHISTYRIGYAESTDGVYFRRKDAEAGIDVSPEGWDSEMICYPYIFKSGSDTFMLYNGNGYGKTGFGLAQLIND